MNMRLPPEVENLPKNYKYNRFVGKIPALDSIQAPDEITMMSERHSGYTVEQPTLEKIYDNTNKVDLTRHKQGANFLFANGHCMWVSNIEAVKGFTLSLRWKPNAL